MSVDACIYFYQFLFPAKGWVPFIPIVRESRCNVRRMEWNGTELEFVDFLVNVL